MPRPWQTFASVKTDGLATPRSMADMKVLSTLESNASSSCVLFVAIRNFFNRFPRDIETSVLVVDVVFLDGGEVFPAFAAGWFGPSSVAP